jgi:putative membrane protein
MLSVIAALRRWFDADGPQAEGSPPDYRFSLANERTFLAWMRTAITTVALGFVVAKFGILLREVGGAHVHSLTARAGAVIGVALVLGGMLAAVTATFRFLQIRRDIENNVVRYSPALDIALAAIVGLASIVLAVYLVVTA